MIYTSINNDKIKNLKKLYNKKYRDNSSLFIIEGYHLVDEAKKSGALKEVYLKENESYDFNDTFYVSDNVMKYITELDSIPNIIGVCEKKESNFEFEKILILDNIQDPGNVGTIIRSAVAFNIDTIVLSKGTADIYSPKVLRATEGMIFNINIISGNLEEIIEKIKQKNIKIYGTKVDGGKSLKTIEKNSRFAIIMGNEGNGVSKELLDLCDENIYINMNSKCESLNVAVATSIILYELSEV